MASREIDTPVTPRDRDSPVELTGKLATVEPHRHLGGTLGECVGKARQTDTVHQAHKTFGEL